MGEKARRSIRHLIDVDQIPNVVMGCNTVETIFWDLPLWVFRNIDIYEWPFGRIRGQNAMRAGHISGSPL